MASGLQRINLMPHLGGLSRFGHSSIKRKDGLLRATNQRYDFDGTKRRRGGQSHLHRIPVWEGRAFSEHFLDRTLDDKVWTTTDSNVIWDTSSYSIYRGYTSTASTAGHTDATLDDPDGDPYCRSVVQTVSDATTETDSLSIVFRTKFASLGASYGDTDFFSIDVNPGTGSGHWSLDIRFSLDGIYLAEGAGYSEVSTISGVVDELSAGVSSEYLTTTAGEVNSSWHNWRMEITYDGNTYRGKLYLEETAIYSNIPIIASGTTTGSLVFYWSTGSGDLDVSIDNIEIEAEAQEIRGLAEWRKVLNQGSIGRTVFYAGSRMYYEAGSAFHLPCFDAGLYKDRIADIVNFQGKVVYTLSNSVKPRSYQIGDRRGIEIGSAPTCKYLTVHANRLWAAGNPDNPSRLYFSGLLNETVWTVDGQTEGDYGNSGYIDVDPEDGEQITGLGPSFRGELIVYKTRSIHRVSGAIAEQFSRVPMTKTIGGASNHGIVNVVNDQYFLSEYGVHSLLTTDKYGDLDSAFLSREIQDIWDRDVNHAALQNAWMVNNEALDRVDILLPMNAAGFDGETPNRIMSLHYGVRSESYPEGIWSGPYNVSGWSMGMVEYVGATRPRRLVGSRDGYLNVQDEVAPVDFRTWGAI